jgi:dTDP-4-amino-4,6-dideoxygalactose transaminase
LNYESVEAENTRVNDLIEGEMDMYEIPFNRPTLVGKELYYMSVAIHKGHGAGDGEFTRKCSTFLEHAIGTAKVLLTTSGTSALEMAAILLNIQQGDEVIVPSFTFSSSANAFVMRGAKPVFVDIRPDTLNMDESQVERLINDRTKALVPVHYSGIACEMDSICEIATRRNIAVVEDNAHGLFGKYKGKNLGTFGTFAAQSFHDTKNFVCGEGGALIINDTSYIERAEIIREKGTNRSRFFRGEVDKYSWVDIGSSYLLSDILAAFLYAQLEDRDQIQGKRRQIWEYYYEHLRDWASIYGVRLPTVPAHCEQTYHIFYLIMPSLKDRGDLISYLKANKIKSVYHYLPLNKSEMGIKSGSKEGDCPVSETISDRLIRLPLYYGFSICDQDRVIETIKNFRFSL